MDEETEEILCILQEECAEVIQEVSKCIRFGPDQCYAREQDSPDISNINRLQKELGDVVAMIDLLVKKDIGVTKSGITSAKHKKFAKLKQWSNIKIK